MTTRLRSAALTVCSLTALLCRVATAQQSHSWTSHDKIALSYYFYWYNVHDGEHFINPDGSDALTNHPPDDSLANYSYTDVSWHQQQMQDMLAAGIDVALPVYWGNTSDLYWSQTGLRTMVTALQAMAQAGTPFPGIGMFFDTSSMWKQYGGQYPDITTPAGKATFYGMVHDYFNVVPKSLWATIDGRPIIVLYYSSWIGAYDQSSLDYVSQHFQSDFGAVPYIVRERSWTGVVTDAAYGWGAALGGPIVVGDTAAVGPGFDNSAVPNVSPHRYRDRQCGGFYQQGWDAIISNVPRLVFVETWNELHEATEVVATREYGRQYIDLTARNVARWKSTSPTPSFVWLSPGRDSYQAGLRIALNTGDGVWHVNRVEGRDAVDVDRTSPITSSYIYLDIADGFVHAVTTPLWVTVEYLDTGSTPWRIEYDGANNPYTVSPRVPMGNTGLWKRVTFALPDAYFGGRENGGSDLRIDDYNNTGEIHYFSRVWITKSAPSASTVQLAPLADVVVSPGATMELPLTVSSSDGSTPSLTLASAPAFASLQSRNGSPVLVLAPSIYDAHACLVAITIVVTGATVSLPDATSLKVLVPNTSSGVTCSYQLSLGGQAFAAPGGTGTVTITTGATCPWVLGTPPAGVAFTSAVSGTGSGAVTFEVFANSGGDRSGSFTIAGHSFTIEQEAASISGLSFVGSMPHVPAETDWNTTFTFVNKGMAPAIARTNLFATDGTALALPLTLPQQPGLGGALLGATLDQTVAPNASFVMEAAGLANSQTQEGSAQLLATDNVDGFAIFHFNPNNQEAVVPMETRNAVSYLLAFDNTNGVLTGVALANVSTSTANIPVTIRDDTGTLIATGSVALAGSGHTSFVLSAQYPSTANMRGTVEFDTLAGGQISVLGIRFTPPGTTTTIPALANIGIAGGLMAHLAVGTGWETTFVLVNTGGAAAQAHLKFFDKNGNPLPLPLSFRRAGGGPSTTAATLDQTIAAGASLWVQVTEPAGAAFQEGSAQLTTNGNIGGFAIFRFDPNGQEAVVPLESRSSNSYLIAYDNTGGIVTGIAISSLSQLTTLVPVTLRDDTGTVLGTGSIPLDSNGHISFSPLATRFPQTAGLRGIIQFDAPQGAQISVLGIRSPPALTFTTLPALAK